MSWGCHEDCQHPRPPLTVSPLLPSSRVISSSTPGCTDSVFILSSVRACVCLRANFPLSHKTCQSLPSMLVSIDFSPSKCQHTTGRISSASAADSLLLWLLSLLCPSPFLSLCCLSQPQKSSTEMRTVLFSWISEEFILILSPCCFSTS